MSSKTGPPFVPSKTLINAKFEGYKLHALSQADCVTSFPLPKGGASQVTTSNSIHRGLQPQLSFKEVRDRITFNHLAVGLDGATLGYIGKDGTVTLVRLGLDGTPCFNFLFEIPHTIQGSGALTAEYPCLRALNRETWIISDGKGNIYIVKETSVTPSPSHTSGTLLAVFGVPHEDIDALTVPMRLHAAHITSRSDGESELTIRALISHKVVKEQEPFPTPELEPKPKTRPQHRLQFRLSAISMQFPLNEMSHGTELKHVSILWSSIGDDLPVYVRYSSALESYLLLAESAYTTTSPTGSAVASIPPPRDPLPEEIAPIPRAHENLEAQETLVPRSIPPYTWTQNDDSVTIAFFLPANIPKAAIRITLGPNELSVLIIDTGDSIATAKRLGLKIPSFTRKGWWDRIDARASFWTWDKEGGREYAAASRSDVGEFAIGVLTLYLEKGHEKTRWPHVFASAGTRPTNETDGQSLDEGDLDVPETLDPTELFAVREALEKYTASLASGEDASGLGLGKGPPSLSRKEIDDEVDNDIGRNVVVMWRKADDGTAPLPPGEYEYPIDLLSHPMPLPLPDDEAKFLGAWSIVIKKGVDGLLFNCNVPPTGITSFPPPWKHEATFSALAFVLASKRDTRFTFHSQAKVVVALEGGTASPAAGGNAFIYRGIERIEEKWAKQAVLKVGGGNAGALLGVAELPKNKGLGQAKVVCLCEKELIIVQGII